MGLMNAWQRIEGRPKGQALLHICHSRPAITAQKVMRSKTYLEVKCITSLSKAHSDISPLSTFALDSKNEIS
jgi:hypothetical protein